MSVVCVVLGFKFGEFLASPAVSRWCRRVSHVAVGRPLMYGITVKSGTVHVADRALIENCRFLNHVGPGPAIQVES